MKIILMMMVLLSSLTAFAEEKITLFVTLTPAGSFTATSKKPKGNLIKQKESLFADKISVSIESFKTGIELRDEHFWKHLKSVKHPKAVLTALKAKGGKGTAMLEVHGVKKPINFVYVDKGSEVNAKFKVRASNFKLPQAEYLGVGVGDIVTVEATLPYKTR